MVWIGTLLAVAALVAVVLTFLPGVLVNLGWLHGGPKAGQSTIDLAEQALSHGDPSSALQLAKRAVSEDSSDAVVDNRAANVALRAGDAHAAERDYLAGESADARYAWNFVNLGQLYAREGKREQADAQLRAASVAAPDQPFIHYDLGVVELQEHLYAAALADFDAELKRSPLYRPAMIGRAEALQKMGRGSEAVLLYHKAGVDAHAKNAKPPALAVKPIAQPSPTAQPSPAPTASPIATPSPQPAVAVLTPAPTARPAPTRASPRPTAAPARPPWATAPASGALVATAPTAAAKALSAVSIDARNYLLDVAQDLGFTRSLPPADPSQSTATLRNNLAKELARKPLNVDALVQLGAAALLSGRLALATSAFSAVSEHAPNDWRGPYFGGLAAQAGGDLGQTQTLLRSSLTRQPRAETYTSLAVVDLESGDAAAAAASARQAVALNPSYEPGRFVAGMIDLIQADVRGAEANLSAAQALGGAPSKTGYFLDALHNSVGAANSS